MAHYGERTQPDYIRSVRRIAVGIVVFVLIALFLLWRIDNARVERLRVALVDRFVPSFEWTLKPLAAAGRMIGDFQAYNRVYEQNNELRRELQRMQAWREVALQLEQKNAKLLAINNVRLNPGLTYVTGEIVSDPGSPFSRSAMVNVGTVDGVEDGAAAMDGLGLVGRIAGVASRSSRIIFLTDTSSRVPVIVLPSGQRAVASGDNSSAPVLEFLEQSDAVSVGDRVVTSGAGGLYPPDILLGRVVDDGHGRHRVRPAADYGRLDFVRVVRSRPATAIEGPGGLIGPLRPESVGSLASDTGAEEQQ
ncbi:rod shape-determining protein MreC [Amaricoccus tamworthensis]|uniref:rod shape-determining protein MreC n=1 Tax=Amaricoccus tamworthensis TaxID=57002 RepID=UPI003C7E2345